MSFFSLSRFARFSGGEMKGFADVGLFGLHFLFFIRTQNLNGDSSCFSRPKIRAMHELWAVNVRRFMNVRIDAWITLSSVNLF
jgi:hypothetical protein